MSSQIIDPLTKTEDVLIALLNSDPALSVYNWQRWESDVEADQPRGYINVTATTDLIYAEPLTLRCEVVLEGKPKRGSQANSIAIILAMLSDPALGDWMNARVADHSIQYKAPAERLQVTQSIEGDRRIRRAIFNMAAVWNVAYSYV